MRRLPTLGRLALVLCLHIFFTIAAGLWLTQATRGEVKIPSTERLIEQLSSANFADRERASQMLQARGPSVLPALRKALSHRDPEVRRRVQDLIPVLEAVAALEPKRITLQAANQPLARILQEIEKQTGYKVVADGKEGDRPFRFEMKDVPFWEAIERVRRETGLTVGVHLFEDGIRLKPGGKQAPFVVVNGPFRLEATRFHEDRDVDFTEAGKDKELGRRDQLLTLTVSVLAEPKFILLAVEKAQVEVARDEDKKPLGRPAPPDKRDEDKIRVLLPEVFRKDFQHSAEVFLQRSSEKAKTLRELRGAIPVQVVVERKPVVVTENVLQSKGTKCQVGGDTLEVTRAERIEDRFYLHLAVPPDRGEIKFNWRQRVHLEDGKGNRCESNGGGSSRFGNQHEVTFSYNVSKDKVGAPKKLIVEDWIILRHLIPFEFKDVPLP